MDELDYIVAMVSQFKALADKWKILVEGIKYKKITPSELAALHTGLSLVKYSSENVSLLMNMVLDKDIQSTGLSVQSNTSARGQTRAYTGSSSNLQGILHI